MITALPTPMLLSQLAAHLSRSTIEFHKIIVLAGKEGGGGGSKHPTWNPEHSGAESFKPVLFVVESWVEVQKDRQQNYWHRGPPLQELGDNHG